jgi:two-component system chemotaxis response regulator CheB
MTEPIRVLVVDDSALMRRLLTRLIEAEGDMKVVGIARDGEEAVEKARSLRPDAVTMDVNMPRVDGLTALAAIVEEEIAPVLVVSSLAKEGTLTAFEALELGAFDCVEKPGGTISRSLDSVREEIRSRLLATRGRKGRRRPPLSPVLPDMPPSPRVPEDLAGGRFWGVALGISTGGPRTIYSVLPQLPANLNGAIFLVQHMPPTFTRMYAERLDEYCAMKVDEADEGMEVLPGHVYVGRGGRHLRLRPAEGGFRLSLERHPPGFFVPSVGVMMNSVFETFGPLTLGVLMTGMGDDGADAMVRIRRGGGETIAESEESAIVFGMPAAAISRGGAERVLPAERIARGILETVGVR